MRRTFLLMVALAVAAGSARSAPRKSPAEMQGLRGPVHTVLTARASYLPGGRRQPERSIYRLYDPAGKLAEETVYETDNSILSHTVYLHQAAGNRTVHTGKEGASEMDTSCAHNQDGDIEDCTLTVTGAGARSEHSERVPVGEEGSQSYVTGSDGVRRLVSETAWDAASGTYTVHSSQDGKLFRVIVQRCDAAGGRCRLDHATDAQGRAVWAMENLPDGSRRQVTDLSVEEGRPGLRWYVTDAAGHITESGEDSPKYFQKDTFRFDAAGRVVEETRYARDGKTLFRQTHEYQDDAQGNWIRQVVRRAEPGEDGLRVVEVETRSITYY